jgi:hypothetical protein
VRGELIRLNMRLRFDRRLSTFVHHRNRGSFQYLELSIHSMLSSLLKCSIHYVFDKAPTPTTRSADRLAPLGAVMAAKISHVKTSNWMRSIRRTDSIGLLTVYLPVLVSACTRVYKREKLTSRQEHTLCPKSDKFRIFFFLGVRALESRHHFCAFIFLQQVKQDDKPTSKMSFH